MGIYRKFLAIALIGGVLASCGGWSGSSTKQLGTPTTVQGTAVKGKFNSGLAALYEVEDGKRSPKAIATALLDNSGSYSFSGFTRSDVLCIEITNGTYIDEATGAEVSQGDGRMVAVIARGNSGTITAAVTPLTTMAAEMAQNLPGGLTPDNAESANLQVGQFFGGLDILGDLPVDITQPDSASASSTAQEYGAILAGISQQAADTGLSDPFDLVEALARDASDGDFDGEDDSGPVALGGATLSPTAATGDLASAVTKIVEDEDKNKSGAELPAETVESLSTSTGALPAPASIRVTPDALTLRVGESSRLAAFVLDAEGVDFKSRSFEFKSSDRDVATVSENGTVTGRSPGTAEINARAAGLSATITVMVEKNDGAARPTIRDVRTREGDPVISIMGGGEVVITGAVTKDGRSVPVRSAFNSALDKVMFDDVPGAVTVADAGLEVVVPDTVSGLMDVFFIVDGVESGGFLLEVESARAPEILEEIVPAEVSQDGVLDIRVVLEDKDGPIESVTVDLRELGGPVAQPLGVLSSGGALSQRSGLSRRRRAARARRTTYGARYTVPRTVPTGAYRYTITARDPYRNRIRRTFATRIIPPPPPPDTTPPLPPTIDAVVSPTNVAGLTLSGTKSSDTVAILINGSPAGVFFPSAGSWIVKLTLSEGDNPFTVSAKDAAGNESAAATATVTLDATPPAVPVIDAVSTPTSGKVQIITGTRASDASRVVVRNNGNAAGVLLPTATTWQSDVPLTEGANHIEVTAKDDLDNESAAATVSIDLDTTPPAAPTIDAVATPTNIATQTITGTKSADAAVVLVNGSASGVSFPTATSWSAEVVLAEGSNTVSVATRDALGNESVAVTASVILDTEPPSGTALSVGSVTEMTIALSWTPATDNLSSRSALFYRVYVSTEDFSSTSDLAPVATVAAGGTSHVVNGLSPITPYYLAVLAVDEAGNEELPAAANKGTASTTLFDANPWTADPTDQAGAGFGSSVASAGDVNGDGFEDVIVGARDWDGAQPAEGRAYLYLGSSTGLASTSAWTADPTGQAGGGFGWTVASAGDVNGDGFDDVIVGAFGCDGEATQEGRAYLYLGSSTGLASTPAWTADPTDQFAARFGWSVACAGDVNGDGFDDVVVGAYSWDGEASSEGRAYLYLGSSTGLASTPAWTADSTDQVNALFGGSVASAGDVNGDGFDDVIVGAWAWDGEARDEGRAYLYLGSSTGLASTPAWIADPTDQAAAKFGLSVASSGDVNGDGFDDVIVGALGWDGEQVDEGRAYLYLGSSTGLESIPAWLADPTDQASALFGISGASAGDVNGDGFDDVIAGAVLWDGEAVNEGRAYVYSSSGSPTTLVSGTDLTAGSVKTDDSTPAAGQTVHVAFTIQNRGDTTTTSTSSVEIYLSADAAVDGGDTLLLTRTIGTVPPRGKVKRTLPVVIPAGQASGAANIIVVADAAGAIPEADETNNTTALAITVP